MQLRFLSTLSLRRATIFNDIFRNFLNNFYPRSPCGERRGGVFFGTPGHISIHALLAESDVPIPPNLRTTALFLSTLSLRRATDKVPNQGKINQFLSTLSLRRATACVGVGDAHLGFLSTLSLRRATFSGDHGHISGDISIHALLAESDETSSR